MNKKQDNDKNSWIDKIRQRVIWVAVDEETFEERFSFGVSKLNLIYYVAFFTILVMVFSWILIAYTPIRTYIPGYPDPDVEVFKANLERDNLQLLDELEAMSDVQKMYRASVMDILNGLEPKTPVEQDSGVVVSSDVEFRKSLADSAFVADLRAEEKYDLDVNSGIVQRDHELAGIHFFPPLKGGISSPFNKDQGHFGVDIIAPEDGIICATLDGVVTIAAWTVGDGHIIQLQHGHNIVSICKHNAVLLKELGEEVKAGEPIAIIGNSGEHSTGSHLHFELWYKGSALNPENFIVFE